MLLSAQVHEKSVDQYQVARFSSKCSYNWDSREGQKNEEKYSNNKVMSLKLFIFCLHDYEMQCINGKKISHIKKLDDQEVFLTVPPSEYEKVPQGSLFKEFKSSD